MISLDGIPEFTGNLEQLEKDAPALKTDAGHVRKTGQGVHDQFQGLSAYYTAPEAEQLFATTRPVKEKADGFATKLEAVSDALSAYATEVRPIVERLKRLRADAAEFIRENGGDDDWKDDGDKVQHNNDLIADVGAATAAFEAAERSCANKISALVGGTHWVVDDGTHKPGMYGYTADVFQHAEKTPWGTQESETHHWYEFGHWIKSFVWDGFIVDGVWGTIRGLGTMVGVDGWDAFKNSWANLGKLAVGLSLNTLLPGWYMTPDSMLPGFLKSTKHTMINAGKAMVAWDEWGKNPARAAGGVTFNVLTAIATDGAGSAAKSGAVARTLSVAGKVGKVVDPMTYVFKGAGIGLSKLKVGDLVSHLKNLRAGSGVQLPDGSLKLPDDTVFRPDGSVKLPDGSVLHKNGALELPDGTVHDPVHEPSAADRQALDAARRARQRELAHVGAPGHEVGRAPDDLGPRASDDGPKDPPNDPPNDPPEKHTPTTSGGSHPTTHDTGAPGGPHDPGGPGGPGGPHDPGGPGGPHDPGGPGDDGFPAEEPRPLERGGETEQRIREALKQLPGPQRPKPQVLEKALSRLAEHPNGNQVGEILASGRFSGSENYWKVVSSLGSGRPLMVQPSIDQLRFANDLYDRGFRDIDFEIQENGCDIDVRVSDNPDHTYGYQMKRLDNPKDPLNEITRPKYLGQLQRSDVDRRIMLVDGQGTLAEWQAKGIPRELMEVYEGKHRYALDRGKGVAFVIRLDDGTLVVPPGADVFPRSVQ
ncbi:hypothetical protein Z951_28360 [Streptomyces sp. PRh5]|uniref:hypothetical protein n=1 Tax=Streptomyces sp. PRh5 TaxID=1158056 RepID=UPI0004516F00|nr:hypothetical protein [Streptomyces sp. PRh5]EXU64887.1 hypothetical protein Z951_28360 [Streptomyces sp. PRh5]